MIYPAFLSLRRWWKRRWRVCSRACMTVVPPGQCLPKLGYKVLAASFANLPSLFFVFCFSLALFFYFAFSVTLALRLLRARPSFFLRRMRRWKKKKKKNLDVLRRSCLYANVFVRFSVICFGRLPHCRRVVEKVPQLTYRTEAGHWNKSDIYPRSRFLCERRGQVAARQMFWWLSIQQIISIVQFWRSELVYVHHFLQTPETGWRNSAFFRVSPPNLARQKKKKRCEFFNFIFFVGIRHKLISRISEHIEWPKDIWTKIRIL